MNKVEQFVKLQQMPVSISIFFVGCILVGVGSRQHICAENTPFQHEVWDIWRVTPKIVGFFGGCRFAAAIQDE